MRSNGAHGSASGMGAHRVARAAAEIVGMVLRRGEGRPIVRGLVGACSACGGPIVLSLVRHDGAATVIPSSHADLGRRFSRSLASPDAPATPGDSRSAPPEASTPRETRGPLAPAAALAGSAARMEPAAVGRRAA